VNSGKRTGPITTVLVETATAIGVLTLSGTIGTDVYIKADKFDKFHHQVAADVPAATATLMAVAQ
jgi:hypothetical protein